MRHHDTGLNDLLWLIANGRIKNDNTAKIRKHWTAEDLARIERKARRYGFNPVFNIAIYKIFFYTMRRRDAGV